MAITHEPNFQSNVAPGLLVNVSISLSLSVFCKRKFLRHGNISYSPGSHHRITIWQLEPPSLLYFALQKRNPHF